MERNVSQGNKVKGVQDIEPVLDTARNQGKVVALCHGVFDLLHPGHFRHLRTAKDMADVLVVTITGDKYVGKGPGRPVFPQELRAEALASLEAVDHVLVIEDQTALPAITAVRPDLYVKGQEYSDEVGDPTGNIRAERELVEEFGGKVVFTQDIVFSSSQLINTFMPQHPEVTQRWLSDLKAEYSIEEIFGWLDALANLNVTVVGEAILDLYTSCHALGKASKEPVLCFNRGATVTHGGGALAIASHCAGLGARVTLITGLNSKDSHCEQIDRVESLGVEVRVVPLDPRPTIRKERLVDNNTQSRIVEIYQMDDTPLTGDAEAQLLRYLSLTCEASDVVLMADYGHGFITERAIDQMASNDAFLAVNAQTNAGNQGFNFITKYPRADFAALNGNEARLEVRRRHVDFDLYMPELRQTLGARCLLVTQGANGVDLYLPDRKVEHGPALAPFVKDRVGAGDAVLSATSLLSSVGTPAPVIALVANIVGAWAVSFLGNERTISLGELKRQITATLK